MKKPLFFFLVFFFCFSASSTSGASQADNQLGIKLLPKGRLFRLTFSDPREIRMGLSFQGASQINATVGNYFSLLGLGYSDEQPFFHFGLEGAGYFTMRQENKRFPLETADGLIGAYFEAQSGSFQGQFRLTHISAHLADGSQEAPIAYSREFAVLRLGFVPQEELQLYTGLHYLINTVPPAHPWAFQLGGNYFLPFAISLVPFFGFDLKWREETKTNPSFQVLLGLALNNPPQAYRSFRIFYAYYTGADPRGQFFNSLITNHSVGIELQI